MEFITINTNAKISLLLINKVVPRLQSTLDK